MKSKILKALAVLQAAAVFGGYGVGAVPVSAEKDLGPWSFFAGNLFNYNQAPETTETTYYDTSNFKYEMNTRDNEYGGVSSSRGDGTDRNWDAWIKTMPNSTDNRFEISSAAGKCTTETGAGVMFTVPENGLWAIECDALNKGKLEETGFGYGTGNAVRICVLDKDEFQETSENCFDFPVRKAVPQVSGDESIKGYYRSEDFLSAGTKIMMRLSLGKDAWGDSIYISYKIHKVNAKGDILETYDLNQIGVQTKRTIVSGEDSLTANKIETDTASIVNDAKFGNWEFFKVNQFYDRATAKDRTKDKYFTESDMTANHGKLPLQEIAGGIAWNGTQSAYQREGIVVTGKNQYIDGDNNWNCGLEIYPGSADKLVRFIPAPYNGGSAYGIAVRFTVPENGEYSIRTDIKNYGKIGEENKLVGFGTENYGRVTIFKGSEKTQSAANTTVFEIPNRNVQGDNFDPETNELSAGDRIWLEIYNGTHADFDDFMGHVIIEKLDEVGRVLKSYNLGESSFTKLGNWNLFTSAKGVEDTFKYIPLQAADVNTLTNTLSGFNSYAARTLTSSSPSSPFYWGAISGKVTMKNEAPSFGWNSGDESAVVRTTGNDMIITYDIPEDGTYNIKAATQLLSDTGATVTVSKTIPKKTPLETTEVTPVTPLAQFIARSEKNTNSVAAELLAGDRIEFRIANTGNDEAILRINPSVAKVEESISVVSGGVNVINVNKLLAGSKIDIERNAISDGAMLAALYEKTDSGLKLIAVDVSNGSGSGLRNFSASVTIPTDADASKAILKIMMLDLTTLEPTGEALTY